MKNIKFLAIMAVTISALSLSACTKNATNNQNSNKQVSETSNIATETPLVVGGVSPDMVFKISDVSSHNSRNDCWTIIDGKIYDLTAYIASGEHKPVIVDGCGIDSTEMFNNVGKHSGPSAQNMLPGMLIGTLGN